MRVVLLALLATLLAAGEAPPQDPDRELEAILELLEQDRPQALKRLRELVLIAPDYYPAQYNLGSLLIGDAPDAAALHLKRATASPEQALRRKAWFNLALARHRLGQLEAAVDAAEQALKLNDAEPEDQRAAQQLHAELQRLLLRSREEARRRAAEARKRLRLDAEQELPPAWEGEIYQAQIAALGGAGEPYRFAPTAALPPGLQLSADGRLGGTPADGSAGEHDLALLLQDAGDGRTRGSVALTVLPEPALLTDELPDAVLDQPYQAELRSEGFLSPQWRAEGLPSGLTLNGSGASATLTGTADEAGEFHIDVLIGDRFHERQRRYRLRVGPDLFGPAQTQLPPATAWHDYQHRLAVRGPPGDYRWSAPSHGGLHLADDGLLSGQPEQAGELRFPATLIAADGRRRDCHLQVTVNPPPVIEEQEPISLQEGRPISRQLRQSGGTAPLRWALLDGDLPDGLQLGEDGRLIGVTLESGSYPVRVAVVDRWRARARKDLTLEVEAPPEQDEQQQEQEQEQQPQQDQEQQGQQQQEQEQEQEDQQQQGQQSQQGEGEEEPAQQQENDDTEQGSDEASDAEQAPEDGDESDDGEEADDQERDDGEQDEQAGPEQRDDGGGEDDGGAEPEQRDDTSDQLPQLEFAEDGEESDDDEDASAAGREGEDSGTEPGTLARDAEEQAERLQDRAAQRWLDSLPAENRTVLLMRALEGRTTEAAQEQDPW